jgi:hypothetical protein
MIVGSRRVKSETKKVCTKQSNRFYRLPSILLLYTRLVNNYLEERGMTVIEKRGSMVFSGTHQLSVTYARSQTCLMSIRNLLTSTPITSAHVKALRGMKGRGGRVPSPPPSQGMSRLFCIHICSTIPAQRHSGNPPAKPHFHHIPVDNL